MRPVLTREEYLKLRNGGFQKENVARIRQGDGALKASLVQMNYSCLPNEDGTLKGSKRMSTTVGMDIDHLSAEEMPVVRDRILSKKDELGLRMLEESARGGGYHLVFSRRAEMNQEENLKWASELLGVKFDAQAKDITRVFFTTTEAELIYLEDGIFETSPSPSQGGEDLAAQVDNSNTSSSNTSSSCASPSSPLGRPGEVFPTHYHGIPFTTIIAKYWELNNHGFEPTVGDRDTLTYQLACDLRHICGKNADWLDQVIPCYDGFTPEEKREKIKNALASEYNGFPLRLRNTLNAIEAADKHGQTRTDDEAADKHGQTRTDDEEICDSPCESAAEENLRVPAPSKLPLGLKESLVGVPEAMHMPVLCALMPLAAAYADQVEVRYCDGEMQKLGMMSIIYGEQASGKSVCKHAVNIWKRQLDEEDALARKREDEWKERKKSRKANEKAPEDPKVLIRVVPVTVSCSTLLKRLKNAQGHTLFSFGEELDTLRKTNGAGSWSSKYDIYRLAFDPIDSEWGQDYNSDQAESGVVRVAYNWAMLGTNGAVRKCFKSDNVENGLSSRILLAQMPDTSFAKMPRYGRRSMADEAKIQEAVNRLRSFSGFVDTPRLRKAIDQWAEEQRVEALKNIDHVKDTYRRRAAVIGFRCGVIYHLLETSPQLSKGRESKNCIQFALMMADYCLNQQIKVFGDALQNQFVDAQQECQRYGANNSIFDQLPPTFTADDLAALKPGNVPRNSITKIISRWRRDGWVEKTDSKRWSKRTLNIKH